jgi:4-diphosphocytidyl-2-C-methyl-D-erythritol kinase
MTQIAPICIRSRAKLNWYLRVGPPRPDGYHDIETLFQELDLADELTFTAVPDSQTCSIDGFPPDVPADTNLITRGWQLLRRDHRNIGGLHVAAEKRLPRGGGLGGGSSNAAATLCALNQLYDVNLTAAQLQDLGAQLGSDVPFFIRGGLAKGHGRGEKLEHLSDLPSYHLVLVFPTHGISTREAYARLDALHARTAPITPLSEVVKALQSGNPSALAAVIYNDFELAAQAESWFSETVFTMNNCGALRTFLCGSGSTIAGLATDLNHSLEMYKRLCNILPYSCCTVCTFTGTRTLSAR